MANQKKNPVIEAVFALVCIWAGIAFFDYLGRARWLNTIRYAVWYSVNGNQVEQLEDKPPSDCDFFHAPIGFKGCKYEKSVTVQSIITSRDTQTNRPIVSYDDGKTWEWNDTGTPVRPRKTVYISWDKKDD